MSEGETAPEAQDPALPEAGEARHPEPELLERFMRCELPRSEAPAIVRHLLTNCPQCLEVTRAILRILVEEEARRGPVAKDATRSP